MHTASTSIPHGVKADAISLTTRSAEHAGNGLDESWRKFCGTVRKCLALYLPLLAADGDVAALAGASAYLRTRSNWTFNVMPDLARWVSWHDPRDVKQGSRVKDAVKG
jgi:hypothetical protein